MSRLQGFIYDQEGNWTYWKFEDGTLTQTRFKEKNGNFPAKYKKIAESGDYYTGGWVQAQEAAELKSKLSIKPSLKNTNE